MNLYRHYKKKFYKYIDTVKHSETREELALYECLYDSPGGKVWVRPKEMFFENIELDGAIVPRFAKFELDVRQFTDVTEEQVREIAPLIEKSFGQWDPKWFHATFDALKNVHLLIAYIDNQAVGFKMGYPKDETTFYSWLGGVLPERQGYGIAAELMRLQHEWCLKNGYLKVQTKTQNRFRKMLLLNIRSGFDIIGTQESNEGFKIVLEKNLQ